MVAYTKYPTKKLAVVVAFFSFAFLFLAMPRYVNMLDEGLILSNAMRVLAGDVIHREFFSLYGPGQPYVVAIIFRVFGEHFIAERIYEVAIRSAVIAALFYIICRQCQLWVALIFTTALGMVFLSTGSNFYLYPIFQCMLFSLI
jgi:hypothetical protein